MKKKAHLGIILTFSLFALILGSSLCAEKNGEESRFAPSPQENELSVFEILPKTSIDESTAAQGLEFIADRENGMLANYSGASTDAVAQSLKSAANQEYIITGSGQALLLSKYESGVPSAIKSGTLAELLSSIDGGRVVFDGVIASGGAQLPAGEFSFIGSLELGGTLTVSEGARLVLTDFSLTNNTDAPTVRIKGGNLEISDSTVIGKREAIVLDYSSAAALTLNSGFVQSESSYAVEIKLGTARLLGGAVVGKLSSAVYCDSSLVLGASKISGAEYGIETKRPITVAPSGISEHTKICLVNTPMKGELTEIVYRATASDADKLSVFDDRGKKYELTYFEEYGEMEEKSFLSVYLPFTVRYFSEGELIKTEYRLRGEAPALTAPAEILGYNFSGWYLSGEQAYEGYSVSSDVDFYAEYTLVPPKITATGFVSEYDGAAHPLSVSVSHPLDSLGGRYTYEWYKNGVLIESSELCFVRLVWDSGDYSCKITFYHKTKSTAVVAEGIKATVYPKILELPKAETRVYNGEEQGSGIRPTSLYTVTEAKGVSAGTYYAMLELVDKENYRFDGELTAARVSYEILPASNRWEFPPKAHNVYFGQSPEIDSIPVWGTPVYQYSTEIDGNYTENVPKDVGIYYVIAYVPESENYSALSSEPQKFEIIEERAVGLEIISPPQKTDYFAFESFSAAGLVSRVTFNSGRTLELSADKLTVAYQTADSFRWGDNGVSLSYLGVFAIVEVTVKKADYDLSGIKFTDSTLTFCGEHMLPTATVPEIVGLDGIPLKYRLEGGGKDAGEYSVSLIFETDSTSYNLPNTRTVTLTVLPLEVELEWSGADFVYDGTPKSPSAYYVDVRGNKRAASVSGASVSAGANFSAFATVADKNYRPKNPSISFSIAKASYNLSGVSWSGTSFVYSGEEHKVTISGLPEGISVVGYTDGAATDAGKYVAEAIFVYDELNYDLPVIPSFEWEILPADYDMSGVRVESVVKEYDGNIHYPILLGDMPVGHDGSSPTYKLSEGAVHVSDGEVTVTVSFFSQSKNYNSPESIWATVRITPKSITVLWSDYELTYCGTPLVPNAETPLCSVTVSGESVDAGSYVATAVSDNPDYHITNSEFQFTIKKAENGWVLEPTVESIYESGTLSPSAKPIFGEPVFDFYTDADCLTPCEHPTESGLYYAKATVPESKNYVALTSSPIRFEIIKVVPVGISVELLNDVFVAFSQILPEQLRVTVNYNDGTQAELVEHPLITYQHSTAFLAKDEYFKISCMGYTETVNVIVKKAVYDMSGARWLNTVAVFDGTPHAPTLSGLPDGVFVESYSLSPVSNAGEYVFSAHLSYDSENYEQPTVEDCSFTLRKCTVPNPEARSLIYCGKAQEIESDSPLYTVAENSVINAGIYTLKAIISDYNNYEFADGLAEREFTVTVLPAELVYSLPDFEIYLFDDTPTIEPTLLLGEVFDGDIMTVSTYIENGQVVLRSNNPNYKLLVRGGRVAKYNYPSGESIVKIALAVLVLLILILMLILAFLSRDRIFAAFLSRKARVAETGALDVRAKSEEHSHPVKPMDEKNKNGEQNGSASEKNSENADGTDSAANESKAMGEDSKKSAESIATENKILGEDRPKSAESTATESATLGEDSKKSTESTETENKILGEDRSKSAESTAAESATLDEERQSTSEASASHGVNIDKADRLITDSLAKDLIKKGRETVVTSGRGQGIINVDTLSRSFRGGDRVDVNILKEKRLIPYDTAYLKVLARGVIDKPLCVYANEFSLSAVKMIALTGGEAVKVNTVTKTDRTQKR